MDIGCEIVRPRILFRPQRLIQLLLRQSTRLQAKTNYSNHPIPMQVQPQIPKHPFHQAPKHPLLHAHPKRDRLTRTR